MGEDEKPDLSADAAKQAKQLDSITDFVDEKETSKIDVKEVEERLKDLRKKQEELDRHKQERDKQLAAVKVNKGDLELMCAELPLCEKEALDRVLREHNGDLVAALRSATRTYPTIS